MAGLRILLVMLLAALVLPGCSFLSGNKTPEPTDVPQYTEAEVTAKVFEYVSDRLDDQGMVSLRQLEPEKWKAKHLGSGEWQVTAIGVSYANGGQPQVRNDSGAWRYYARLDLIVPYNQEARDVFA